MARSKKRERYEKIMQDYVKRVENSIKEKGAWEDWYRAVFEITYWHPDDVTEDTLRGELKIWKDCFEYKPTEENNND